MFTEGELQRVQSADSQKSTVHASTPHSSSLRPTPEDCQFLYLSCLNIVAKGELYHPIILAVHTRLQLISHVVSITPKDLLKVIILLA